MQRPKPETQPPQMTDRTLGVEGVDNFRDYGGYVAAGGRLRERMLFRSAHHGNSSPRDLDILGQLGIAAVIDLRGPSERAKAPSRWPDGFAAQIFETEIETGAVAPHLEAAAKGATSAAEAHDVSRAVYADLPYRAPMISALRRYFRVAADVVGPSLIHCAAGKDRTGVAVALLHAALGVHRDDIITDYLLTNATGRFEERMATGIATMRRNFGPKLSEEAARAFVRVEPSYLDAAFDAIEQRSGDLAAYLRAEIGIDKAWHEAAAQRLVV